MSFLSRGFSGEPESRSEARLGSIPRWSEVSGAGYGASPRHAMKMVVFFKCVDILAKTVSTLPVSAYRHTDKGRQEVRSKFMDSPYPNMTWQNWLEMLMRSLAITGNAFGYITSRDPNGIPTAILPIHPDAVRVNEDEGTWFDPVYEIGGKSFDSSDIFHIKAYPVPGCAMGLSPIEHMASTVELGFAAEQYGLRWFKDSANPSGILSTEAELTEQQVDREMKRWIQSNGRGKRYPAVMGGGLKFQPIGIPPNESQFLETRAHQRSDIAMMFGIPPHMIGDTEKSTSWGTGIAEQVLGFQKFTINPWLVCIEQSFNLILPRGQFCKFNLDALLRPDLKTRYEAHKMAIESGMASPNERRAIEDLPPIEGYPGDIYLQSKAYVPLGWAPPEEPNPAIGEGGPQ